MDQVRCSGSFPRLEVIVPALQENMATLLERGKKRGVETVAVTKGFCADQRIVEMLWETGYRKFADANLQNLISIRRLFGNSVDLQLIRLPMQFELPVLVEAAIVPYVSDWKILCELNRLSQIKDTVTRVMLAVETGDGREGFLPEELRKKSSLFNHMNHLKVVGLGTALACLSGVLPDMQIIEELRSIQAEFRQVTGQTDWGVSVGGTTFLSLWEENENMTGIDEIRCGEAWLFGTDISRKKSFSWLRQETFFLTAETIEVKRKSPKKSLLKGFDAFGRVVEGSAAGVNRKRALLACGLQDTDNTQLYLEDGRVTIVGATSNYLVLDVEESGELFFPGKLVCFRAGYGAVLRAFLSPYVDIVYSQHEKVVEHESGIPRKTFS